LVPVLRIVMVGLTRLKFWCSSWAKFNLQKGSIGAGPQWELCSAHLTLFWGLKPITNQFLNGKQRSYRQSSWA
jgi:hypothetical protein